MDDEPMWAADRVVALTPSSAITILETAKEFAIKSNHLTLVKGNQFDGNAHKFHGHNLSKGNIIKIFYHGLNEITQEFLNAAVSGIFLFKTPNQAYQLLEDKVLLKLDWDKNQKTKSSLKKTVAFVAEGSSNFDTDKIMARMDAMTIKMDDQYKELQSRAKQPTPNLDDDDIPMSREEEAKFMQTFHKTRFYNDYHDLDLNRDNWCSSGWNDYNRDNYRPNTNDKSYDLQRQFNDFMKSQQSTNSFVKETFMDLKTQLKTVAKNHQASIQNLETKFDRLAEKSGKSYDPPDNLNYQQNNSETPINFDSDDEEDKPAPQLKTQPLKPVKETPLPKPYKPKILYPQRLRKEKMEAQYGKFLDMIRAVRINTKEAKSSIPSKELFSKKIFFEFDKFIAMATDENYDSESDKEELKFEKITINTNYKIKTSLEEPPTNLELKPLPDNLEYVFLEEPSFLPVIISS
ncbi:hypothetical protein Tco_1555719 [Tanacetum coccineum]